ncbi:MAG: ABC transporter substrate-binding protein [bacterium]|nr:ABC transporter substrate-binding protein [bacterium]
MRLVAALFLCLFSFGCGDSESQETIVYAGSAWYGHAPVWVGIQKGIFEKHGFEVEERMFGSSSDRINALEADNAQFASLGEVAMLTAMSRERRKFYWVGCQNLAAGNEGLVAVDGIKSVAELKGKRIALQRITSVHLTVALLLEEAGLDITKDVTVVNATDSTVVDIVRGGDAAAGAMWEPFYSDLRGLDGATVLGTDKDTSIYKRFKTMSGPDVICASKAFVDADPARAKRFFQAYWEAVAWCKEHPEELLDLVVAHIGKDRKSVETALRNFEWLTWEDQLSMLSDERMFGQAQVASELLKRLGQLETIPKFMDWTRLDWFQQ